MKYDILLENYLLSDDLSTYDPYDIWKTNLGIKIKQLYYKNKYLGIIPAGLITIYDLYLNNTLRLGYKKQEYPIVRAQAVLILLNLYKKENKNIYLEYAKTHIDWLINNSSNGYKGFCWGLNFNWIYSADETYDKNTPFSTHTPYSLEALYEYYKLTKDQNIYKIITSVYEFYEKDLVILNEDKDIMITSYGPFRDRIVTNAVSYTMFAYSIFYRLLDNKEYIKKKIQKMINFIVSVQNDNGSWLYSPYDKNSFVDCFHSVFILKNIIKTSLNIEVKFDVNMTYNGYKYLKENFLNSKYHLFKRFSISNKPSLIKFDLYDNAEMLQLSKLMNDLELAEKLENSIEINFFIKNNIYSIIELFGTKKNKNTLRWAVMPYLLAKSL